MFDANYETQLAQFRRSGSQLTGLLKGVQKTRQNAHNERNMATNLRLCEFA